MTAIHTVDISGEFCVVTVRQKSKMVWVARGDYMGDSVTTQDRSEETALTRWQEVAASTPGSTKNKRSQEARRHSRKSGPQTRAKRQPVKAGGPVRKKPAAKHK
jgi:hypothetical protein